MHSSLLRIPTPLCPTTSLLDFLALSPYRLVSPSLSTEKLPVLSSFFLSDHFWPWEWGSDSVMFSLFLTGTAPFFVSGPPTLPTLPKGVVGRKMSNPHTNPAGLLTCLWTFPVWPFWASRQIPIKNCYFSTDLGFASMLPNTAEEYLPPTHYFSTFQSSLKRTIKPFACFFHLGWYWVES